MQRGRALLAIGALLAAARLLPASADTAPVTPPDPCTPATAPTTGGPTGCEMPRPGCTPAITDGSGDGVPTYVNGETDTTSKQNGMGNHPALDIAAVYLRLTPDYLESFLNVDHIDPATSMAAQDGAYRWIVSFKAGSKTITVTDELQNGNVVEQQNPPDRAGTYPQVQVDTGAGQSAKQVLLPGTTPNTGWVIVSFPRDQLEKNLGAPIDPGTLFTDIKANDLVISPNSVLTQNWPADTTTETGTAAQLDPFDDSCFGPPPTTINSISLPSLTYDHSTSFSAVLLDHNGAPIAGKTLSFTVAGTTVTATTDGNGSATATYGPTHLAAGTYPVDVAFAGDTTTYKHSSATGTLKVSAAKTSFTALKVTKPSAKTRIVTTTLLDDAKKPVAGARVDWYVSGKKVASSTTDKTGKAVFKTGKPGQTVQARYAGKPGMLLACASKSAKL